MIHRQEAVIGGRVMSIETGRVAEQASGAVLVRYGDTVILATVVGSDEPREGIDFFPLTVDGQLVINPLEVQMGRSKLDLAIAGTADAVMMVEAGAKELPEALMLEAVRFGQEALQDIIKMQEKLAQALNRVKRPFASPVVDNELRAKVAEFVLPRLEAAGSNTNKAARSTAWNLVQDELVATLGAQYPDRLKDIITFYEKELKAYVRNNVLDHGTRPDGRDLRTIRPISCEVGLLPPAHGAAIFTRGQTQVLSVVTLGSPGEEQVLDGLGMQESKRFMHHYNFPPFSTGESKPLRGPGRREIGHGALAERAIAPIIPPQNEFPYTIRAVSDVLSSNGSTSMGSVCGTTLALMDAGVPIIAPVAGVAMGLITGEA